MIHLFKKIYAYMHRDDELIKSALAELAELEKGLSVENIKRFKKTLARRKGSEHFLCKF
jgi:hypothetical protein